MKTNKETLLWGGRIALLSALLGFVWLYSPTPPVPAPGSVGGTDEVEIPVSWDDLGKQMVEAGVVDRAEFLALYERRGGLSPEELRLLDGMNEGNLRMTPQNSGVLLNLLWGFGLGNKNEILETGPMMDPRYGGVDRFASTGGWTLANGDPMDHYSTHRFIELTPEQQEKVERVSKGIYRPCCGNATHFPDCNHGMAMLGLLELLAKNDVSEDEMYRVALGVNRLWFPDNYANIEIYLAQEGRSIRTADPREILGPEFSSGQGYQRVLSAITPANPSGGASCGT